LLDITDAEPGPDEEIFGPLLTVHRVPDWDQAIVKANDTKYGLSAGLLSDRAERYQDFIQRIRAGIVNWNRQTTGASGKLPFGGCGWSGNSRPAGYYSADYCSYPVASLESHDLKLPSQREPGLEGT
jgi:succinylglutamic semialdehyde dehydrogenase